MEKQRELTDPKSCLNKARDGELLFVLLGRDAAAPTAVRAWVDRRLKLRLNDIEDPQIVEALQWADDVEREFKKS